ncbi:MAG: cyclic nucleotide-binding domain-containing protein, partial [Ginsengibacter sp.]
MQAVSKVRLVSGRVAAQGQARARLAPVPAILEDVGGHENEVDLTIVRPIRAAPVRVPCSQCKMRPQCLPADLTAAESSLVDGRMVEGQRKVARGASLYRVGDPFESVFAVRTGFFKAVVASDQGLEQVTGFHMLGELLGLGGIAGRHEVDAVALEDS